MKHIVGSIVLVTLLFAVSCSSSSEPAMPAPATEQAVPEVENTTTSSDPVAAIDGPVLYDCTSDSSGMTDYVNLYWVDLETATAHSLREFSTPMKSGLGLAGCSSQGRSGQANRLKFNDNYSLAAVELPSGASSTGHIGVQDLLTGNLIDFTTLIDSGDNAFTGSSRHADPSFDVDGNLVFWDDKSEVWLTFSLETRSVINSTPGDVSPASYNLPQHGLVNTRFFWRIDDFNFLRQETRSEGDEFAITKWTSLTPLPAGGDPVNVTSDLPGVEGVVLSPWSENQFNNAAAKSDGSEVLFTVNGAGGYKMFVANQSNPEQPREVNFQGFDIGYVMEWK